MLKILHTGDIHLDSPFARLDARLADRRREEARASFSAMMAYARKCGVDLVLMAGDIVDREYATRATMELLTREFSRMSCPIVIAPGNHDCVLPGSIWMQDIFPENVYIFRSQSLAKFSFDALHTDVYGYAFTSPEMAESPLCGQSVERPDRINLLCAHGDITSPVSRYAPITRTDLAGFGADYAALAHIHNPPAVERRGKTVSAYCGCLEGRAPDETGPKGAIIAEISRETGAAATVRVGRVRFSRRRYENAEADCTGASTAGDLTECVREAIAAGGYGEDTLLRVTLKGSVAPSLIVDTDALAAGFDGLFSLEVRDETTPIISAAELMGDRTVRGEFYRMLLPRLESADPRERRVAAMALREGLAAMSGGGSI